MGEVVHQNLSVNGFSLCSERQAPRAVREPPTQAQTFLHSGSNRDAGAALDKADFFEPKGLEMIREMLGIAEGILQDLHNDHSEVDTLLGRIMNSEDGANAPGSSPK
ncbi:MAG: hypothetical protein ACREE2_17130 [Stellaceae bacterium]